MILKLDDCVDDLLITTALINEKQKNFTGCSFGILYNLSKAVVNLFIIY